MFGRGSLYCESLIRGREQYKFGLVQSLAIPSSVAAVRQNAGFADNRKLSHVLANCGYSTRN
jgi:hypothetical protein